MTFSEVVKREFAQENTRVTCCRKALVCGALFDADADTDKITFEVQKGVASDFLSELIKKQFPSYSSAEVFKSGRKYVRWEILSSGFAKKICMLDTGFAKIGDYCEFKCKECRGYFLRGVFLCRGTATFLPGSNHFEYRISHGQRAKSLFEFLSACGVEPKIAQRNGVCGLYYKSGEKIEDNLSLMHSTKSLFYIMNERITGDIKKNENRAVNCEAVNILKSVEASQRQIKAINVIKKAGMFDSLGKELSGVAKLRIENAEMSLSELARLCDPPISKSVLNSRFSKIIKIAERLEKQSEEKTNGE